MAPSSVEIVCELGCADRLVGVGEFVTYPPAVSGLPRVGGLRDPDLENILRLHPDLIVLRGRQEKLEQLCRDRRIRVYHDPTDTLADLGRAIDGLGELLGHDVAARSLRASLEEDLNAVRRTVAPLPRVRVLLTFRNPDRVVNVGSVAKGSYLDELLHIAGGENIFGDLEVAYPQVSVEEILARSPEVILEAMPGATGQDLQAQVLAQWREVGSIPAVATGRVHVLTDEDVLVPSPRVVRAMAHRFCAILHPEVPCGG